MPEETTPSATPTLTQLVSQLAPLAKRGVRGFVLIGKTKGMAKRTADEKTGAISVKQEVICGEGSSLKLKFDPSAPVPGPGYEGAFLVDNVTSYQGYKSAECLGFA